MIHLNTQVSIEDPFWQRTDFSSVSSFQKIFEIVFQFLQDRGLCPAVQSEVQISVLLTHDQQIQVLNREYRGKDKPTNILSFPMDDLFERAQMSLDQPIMLGDLILARETIWDEAAKEKKQVNDHLTHLLIHGLLHLLGYDHIEDADADEMESLEIEILKKFDIKNPYEKRDQI